MTQVKAPCRPCQALRARLPRALRVRLETLEQRRARAKLEKRAAKQAAAEDVQ
jgi:hypothetical protein